MAPRHRPRRGDGNVLVSGDTGIAAGPQGGAKPGASESGDLQSREFGVPQADLPGGVNHLVNPQSKPGKPAAKPERPADAHKYHGVPPDDDGQYVTPPDESEPERAPKPSKVPKYADAVPVLIVEDPEAGPVRRTTACYSVLVRHAGLEPSRICNRDDNRVTFKVLNEDSAVDIRICEDMAPLQSQDAQGTGPAGGGSLIWHGTNSYTDIPTQSEMFAITTDSTKAALLSVIIVTEVSER